MEELIEKYKQERKTIDKLLQLDDISETDKSKYLSVRRFLSSFILDLQKILQSQPEQKPKKSTEELITFAVKIAKAMQKIGSSHVYFIMQQAFEDGKEFKEGHMTWENCEEKWDRIINMQEYAQQLPSDELQNLMNEISEWSDKTFGYGQRNPAILYHLKKEVNELIETFVQSAIDSPQNRIMRMEFADCLMLLLDSAKHAGFTANELLKATGEKLEINKKRKWGKPDENGVVEHL